MPQRHVQTEELEMHSYSALALDAGVLSVEYRLLVYPQERSPVPTEW
jgi:hypothetical protein